VNLYCLLDRAALRFPDRGAVFAGKDCVHTYAELRARVLRLAHSLRSRYGSGCRVAIATQNCAEYVELLFGIWAAECVAVPVNYKLHAREMQQIIEDASARVVFASDEIAAALHSEDRASGSPDVVRIGSPECERHFEGPECATPSTAPDTLAWLFYTSGTTGRSKGAMLSHRNLLAMTIAHLADVEAIDEHCSQIHAAPMSHGSGLYIPAYVARGARQVIPASQGFDPGEFLDLCSHHHGVGAFLAPTMVQRLRVACQAGATRPRNLRTIIYGGGPMYVEELKKSIATFGQVFVQIYGQGEAPMTITSLRRQDHALQDEAVLGSVGWPRTGVEVAVFDAHGREAAIRSIGEIACRGDVVMSGYWNDAQGTAEALRDGWLYTGDMGSFDARGYLTLRDRSKDVIISGGSNIYPREVEEVLLEHPSVSEVCVVGETDDEWGEAVVAFVVATVEEPVTESALGQHCLERIARFKRPKRYVFVPALPKNSYGKVLKRELRQQLLSATKQGAMT
jgi:acyl-CoA synthetase (AMP-forming)/AMP-acid ligase II